MRFYQIYRQLPIQILHVCLGLMLGVSLGFVVNNYLNHSKNAKVDRRVNFVQIIWFVKMKQGSQSKISFVSNNKIFLPRNIQDTQVLTFSAPTD